MTPEKITAFLVAAAFVLIPSYHLLLGMLGARSRVESYLWCAPFVGTLLLVGHRYHLALLLIVAAGGWRLPRLITYREVPLAALVPLLILAGWIARRAMGTRPVGKSDRFMDRCLLPGTLATLAWLAIDRPRMGSLGAETGGAWEAMFGIAGLAAYWGIRSLRVNVIPWRAVALTLAAAAAAGVATTMVTVALRGGTASQIGMGLFHRPGWWLWATMLAISVKIMAPRLVALRNVPAYATSILVLVSALLSGFRSRIAFGPLMIAAALWSGAMRIRMLLWVSAFIGASAVLANSYTYHDMPVTAQRVLSVVRFGSEQFRSIPGLGELGRTSPWRAELWKLAWTKIRERPFTGHGYAIDTRRFMADLASAPQAYESIIRGVGAAGEFHNMPINLAYFWGIPASLAFCVAWIRTLIGLGALSRASRGWQGVVHVTILAYSLAATGQGLINGVGEDFLAIATVMGLYQLFQPVPTPAPAQPANLPPVGSERRAVVGAPAGVRTVRAPQPGVPPRQRPPLEDAARRIRR